MGTASGHGQVRDSVEIDPAFAAAEGLSGDPGCGPAARHRRQRQIWLAVPPPPPKAVAMSAGGPTAPHN